MWLRTGTIPVPQHLGIFLKPGRYLRVLHSVYIAILDALAPGIYGKVVGSERRYLPGRYGITANDGIVT